MNRTCPVSCWKKRPLRYRQSNPRLWRVKFHQRNIIVLCLLGYVCSTSVCSDSAIYTATRDSSAESSRLATRLFWATRVSQAGGPVAARRPDQPWQWPLDKNYADKREAATAAALLCFCHRRSMAFAHWLTSTITLSIHFEACGSGLAPACEAAQAVSLWLCDVNIAKSHLQFAQVI